ncbi:MAG: hypothetical protein ACRCU2_11715 [Planktothrix sp.]
MNLFKLISCLATKMIKNFFTPSFLVTVLLAGFSSLLIYQERFEAGMAGAGAAVASASASAKKQEKAKEEEKKELIFEGDNRDLTRTTVEILMDVQAIIRRRLTPDEAIDLINLFIDSNRQYCILDKSQQLEEDNQQLKLEIVRLNQKLEGTKEIGYLKGQNQLMQSILIDPTYSNIFPVKKIDDNNQGTSGFPEQYLGHPTSIEKINDSNE